MTSQAILMPRQPVPELEVATVGGGTWRLNENPPETFTLVVFYRGLHCPICGNYMRDLARRAPELAELGVDVVVISGDSEERAAKAKADWGIEELTVGYGLSLDKAREWGLFISSSNGKTSIGIEEPALFSEPGLYLVRPDGTLYFGTVQTMPFARPSFGDITKAIAFVKERGYPARGEIVDHQAAAE